MLSGERLYDKRLCENLLYIGCLVRAITKGEVIPLIAADLAAIFVYRSISPPIIFALARYACLHLVKLHISLVVKHNYLISPYQHSFKEKRCNVV